MKVQKDPWKCPKCQSSDINYYEEIAVCNNCSASWITSVIYDELSLK